MSKKNHRDLSQIIPPDYPAHFPEVLTTAQAAAFLQISPQTMNYYVMKGIVPFARVGKHVRFSKARLLEWLVDEREGVPLEGKNKGGGR